MSALWPIFCARCGQEGELLCVACRGATLIETLARRCPFCERETGSGATCRRCLRKNGLDGCLAMAHYAEPAVKEIVKTWKYDSQRQSEPIIRGWLRRSGLTNVLPDLPWTLVPVSLHAARCRERGFDQAAILSDWLGQELSFPVAPILRRHKRLPPQAGLGDQRCRPGELRGLFSVVGRPPSYVLLVDDVLTTGATLDAAAFALKIAGSELVWGLVLARGR